jgi:hypothetical protein
MSLLTDQHVAQLFDLIEGVNPTKEELEDYLETLYDVNDHPTPQ